MRPVRSRWVPLVGLLGGLGLAVVVLLVPVHASFGDDPVLRLQGFDRQRSFLPTTVDCGLPTSNLAAPVGTRSLYDVARDDACHRRGVRRFCVAIAGGAVVAAAGLTAGAAVNRSD